MVNKQPKAKSVSFSNQDSAFPVKQPPKQTAFADVMEKWKKSMVDAINSVPTPCVGDQTVLVHPPMSHSQIYKQPTVMVPQWDGSLQLEEDNNPILVACGDGDMDLVEGLISSLVWMLHNQFHQAMWARMWTVLTKLWNWIRRIIHHPYPQASNWCSCGCCLCTTGGTSTDSSRCKTESG